MLKTKPSGSLELRPSAHPGSMGLWDPGGQRSPGGRVRVPRGPSSLSQGPGWGHSPPSQPPRIGSGNAQCLTPPRHRCSPACLKASFLGWSGWASCQVPATPERALPSRSHPHPLDFPAAQSPGLGPPTPASIGCAASRSVLTRFLGRPLHLLLQVLQALAGHGCGGSASG